MKEQAPRHEIGHGIDTDATIVIIDSGGKVIANPDPENLLVDYFSLNPDFPQDVLTGKNGNQIAKNNEAVEYLYSYVPVSSAGWGVIVSRPTSIAFSTPYSFHRGVLLMIAVFSGIGIF